MAYVSLSATFKYILLGLIIPLIKSKLLSLVVKTDLPQKSLTNGSSLLLSPVF
jgi:hypothetical protein